MDCDEALVTQMTLTTDMIVHKYRDLGSDKHRRAKLRRLGLGASAIARELGQMRSEQIGQEGQVESYRANLLTQNRIDQLSSYLALFGSHERVAPLLEATCDEPVDIFWPVFIRWWDACDGTQAWRGVIIDTLRRRAAQHSAIEFLDAESRQFLDSLSSPLVAYRGCGRRQVRGLSWTTDHGIAEFFARGGRFPQPRDAVIAAAKIKKSDVFFVSTRRKESEVILDPYEIRQLKLTPFFDKEPAFAIDKEER
jgi:hypothetical protein